MIRGDRDTWIIESIEHGAHVDKGAMSLSVMTSSVRSDICAHARLVTITTPTNKQIYSPSPLVIEQGQGHILQSGAVLKFKTHRFELSCLTAVPQHNRLEYNIGFAWYPVFCPMPGGNSSTKAVVYNLVLVWFLILCSMPGDSSSTKTVVYSQVPRCVQPVPCLVPGTFATCLVTGPQPSYTHSGVLDDLKLEEQPP